MLQTISWSDYLITILLLALLYYVISAAAFYKHEIKQFFNRNKTNKHEVPQHQLTDDVMGGTRNESADVSREVNTESEDLRFAADQDSDSDSLLVGTVSDLLHEIRLLNQKLAEGTKEEWVPVFKELLSKYPQLKQTQYHEAVNLFIMNTTQDSASWELTQDEVESLWPTNN